MVGCHLSGTKIASQNRSDHGGRKRARNHSAAEIAGFFAFPAAKKSLAASDFGVSLKSQENRSDHGRKSPQPRDFAAAATTGHLGRPTLSLWVPERHLFSEKSPCP